MSEIEGSGGLLAGDNFYRLVNKANFVFKLETTGQLLTLLMVSELGALARAWGQVFLNVFAGVGF